MLKFLAKSVAGGVIFYVTARVLEETKLMDSAVRLASSAAEIGLAKLGDAVAASRQQQQAAAGGAQ